jgi:polyhydroxyalkanoate synthase
VRFVLGGSGHIAGIVNPPASKKYHFWTNDALPPTAETWFAGATQQPGSWWEDWQAWMRRRNEETGGSQVMVPARVPGDGALKPLEDAPGSYAMLRIAK